MEYYRYSYNQNDTVNDLDKLLTHIEGLGFHIVQWYTSDGKLHVHVDKKDNE